MGFYATIEEGSNEEVEERCLEVKEGDLGVDVFKVERVVERRTKKVSGCLHSHWYWFVRISLLYK